MAYRIEFFNSKVQADILGWPAGIAASFAAIAQCMVAHGPNLGLPYTRAMGGGCTLVDQQIVILHGFIKKTQQTPVAELRIAKKRLKELHHG